MTWSVLAWIGLCLIFGSGMAADIPYVFNESSFGLLGYSSDQLENISAASPELVGVPPISRAADNETLEFPGNRDAPGSKIYKTVGEIKTAFNARTWRDKGVILYNQGNYGDALRAFDRAIKIDPFCADKWPSKIGSMGGKEKRNMILDFERTFSNIDVPCTLRLSRLDSAYCLRNR